MQLTKLILLTLMLIGTVACSKLKILAINRPHFGFVGIKVKKPKLLGLKHGFGGGGGLFGGHGGLIGGHGGFGGGGGYHSSGYEHHEYHESHHSSGGSSFGGGGWLGK